MRQRRQQLPNQDDVVHILGSDGGTWSLAPGVEFDTKTRRVSLDPAEWPVLLPKDAVPIVATGGNVTIFIRLPGRKYVRISEYSFPSEFYALIDLEMRVALHVRIENGEPVAQAVTVIRRPGEPPLSATTYRKVNLGTLIDVAVSCLIDGTAEIAQKVRAARPTPGRGARTSDEFLESVATVYRQALGRSPTLAVAKEFHTARSNAGRWVMEARRRGILGAAKPGQSGEKGGQ